MATSIINNVQPYGLKRIKKSESTQHAKMWVNTAHNISYTSSTWATSFSIYKFDTALLILEIWKLCCEIWVVVDALVNCFFNIMG